MLKLAAMLAIFRKTPAAASDPAFSARPTNLAKPLWWDLSPRFPAIPDIDYFIRLHRVENQSQS
jgi:hypothetical protein